MPRHKKQVLMVKVRVIGPNCWVGDRLYQPGETVTVPAELAEEWTLSIRAVTIAAEVAKNGEHRQDS